MPGFEFLAGLIPHLTNQSAGGLHVELWQIINLAGSVALAGLMLPPVVEDLKRWRKRSRSD